MKNSKELDYRWQLQNQLTTAEQLCEYVALTDEERQAFVALKGRFRVGVTPYYASLIRRHDPNCAIRRQCIPTLKEQNTTAWEATDPLQEERYSPLPGLTRRYKNRALLFVHPTCAVYCRQCTRRRKVGDVSETLRKRQLANAIQWLADHEEINDIILSGGDALSLSDSALDRLLTALSALPQSVIIRIGTRHPVTLPMRITPRLCSVIKKHAPIYIMTHFNHPDECTPLAKQALLDLNAAGAVLCNQTVLMAGINDNLSVLVSLNQWLARAACRPYRLYQLDFVSGTDHFRVPLSTGLALERALRATQSGVCTPEYVIDLPNGGGKLRVVDGQRSHNQWRFVGVDGAVVVFTNDGARWHLQTNERPQ